MATRLSVIGAEVGGVSEHQVKGACLYKFAKFVEWPASAFPAANTPITIGILGKDPFGSDLDLMVKNKTASGRPIIIKRFADIASAKSCHILFISPSEERRLPEVLGALKDLSVLTVGETAQFTASGGMIALTMSGGTVHITINMDAAEQARLVVSSQIQNLATIIRGGRVRQRR